MIEFKNVTTEYLDDAVTLMTSDYQKACLACPILAKADAVPNIRRLLTGLFQNGLGKLALKEGKLIGYLAFFGPWDGFHGNVKGAFSPLGGNSFASAEITGISRDKLASMLIAAVSDDFVQRRIFQPAISTYAHDLEIARSLVLNGFGIRCSDTIMSLEEPAPLLTAGAGLDPSFSIREVPLDRRLSLLPLKQGLIKHLSNAPALFPTYLSDELIQGQLTDSDIRYFAAYKGDVPIGYMGVEAEGETFICNTPHTANICGAYVLPEYRTRGIARAILSYICETYRLEGYQLLGEDCETLNPTALRFWTKYFIPYTYSYIRRFDERIAGYEQYFEHYFKP